MQYLFSVIIPVYNSAKYLHESINSVLLQKHKKNKTHKKNGSREKTQRAGGPKERQRGRETSQKGAETSENAKKEQKRAETKAETGEMHCIFYSISVGSSKIRV